MWCRPTCETRTLHCHSIHAHVQFHLEDIHRLCASGRCFLAGTGAAARAGGRSDERGRGPHGAAAKRRGRRAECLWGGHRWALLNVAVAAPMLWSKVDVWVSMPCVLPRSASCW